MYSVSPESVSGLTWVCFNPEFKDVFYSRRLSGGFEFGYADFVFGNTT